MKYQSNYLEKTGKILNRLIDSHGQKIINIFSKANSHILSNFGDGFVAGTPQEITLFDKSLWMVPIVMTNSLRFLGKVGVIAIDGESVEILGTTDSQAVNKKVQWLVNAETEMV